MMCCRSNTYLILIVLLRSLVLSLAADSEECGIIDSSLFGNNQRFSQIGEFPWMARIAYNITSKLETVFDCQAVLISPQHLLTVAHCLRDNAAKEPYAVLLGDWNITNSIHEKDCGPIRKAIIYCSIPVLIEIDEVIVHPYFNARKKQNDIGLLRLTQAVTFTDFIRPICLPSKNVRDKEFGSEELFLTGWLSGADGRRRKKPVVIFNQSDCRRKYANFERVNITDSYICGITCDEDGSTFSGAALMDVKEYDSPPLRNVYLVGIVAYGVAGCGSRIPDIFVRVDQYLDWVNENIY